MEDKDNDNYGENFEKERLARKERSKKRHEDWDKKQEEEKPKAQSPKEIKEGVEEEFEKSIEDLKEKPIKDWDDELILKEFDTYPNLRSIFFNVASNSPTMNLMIRISLGYEEEFRKQIQKQLKKLRRMGLVYEELVCESWWKNYLNEKYKGTNPISLVEKKMLKKINLKVDTEERTRNKLIGNSGFWIITNFGKEILIKAKKSIQLNERTGGESNHNHT